MTLYWLENIFIKPSGVITFKVFCPAKMEEPTLYPVYKSKLSGEVLEKAKLELNEDPNTIDQEIRALRQRAQNYPGLRARLDSEFLVRFLRAKKFNQENAFATLLKYYKLKNMYPDIFMDMLPSTVQKVFDDEVCGLLDGRDKNGRMVMCMRTGKMDFKKYTIETVFKQNIMVLLKLIEDEETQVHGMVFLGDLKGFSWEHAKSMNPITMGKLLQSIYDSIPCRFKATHYINEHSIFDTIYSVMKRFMKEKIINRIRFHGDRYGELQDYMDEDILPKEYGGKATFSTWKIADKLIECEEQFKEEQKYRLFETVAVSSKDVKSEDAFTDNVTGTFKKLQV